MTMRRRAACRDYHACEFAHHSALQVAALQPLYDGKAARYGGCRVVPATYRDAMIMYNTDHLQVTGGNSTLHHFIAMKAYATIVQSPSEHTEVGSCCRNVAQEPSVVTA